MSQQIDKTKARFKRSLHVLECIEIPWKLYRHRAFGGVFFYHFMKPLIKATNTHDVQCASIFAFEFPGGHQFKLALLHRQTNIEV